MTLSYSQILQNAIRRLKSGGMDTPDLDARILAGAAFHLSRTEFFLKMDTPAPEEGQTVFETFICRRLAHEPVGRILGTREFWGLPFFLSPDTLEPRPDSETVIESVLAAVPDKNAPLRILDMGTGTGCLLLALLHEYPMASGVGVDASQGAVDTAKQNAEKLAFSSRAVFVQADWNAAGFASLVAGPFDVVVSNPPYISSSEINKLQPEVRCHDPSMALDGGEDGLDAYRQIAGMLSNLLKIGGVAVFEAGQGQADKVQEILQDEGLSKTGFCADLTGIMRCVTATRG